MIERLFVDHIPAQHAGLQQVLRDVPADLVIGHDFFLGLLPTLLWPRWERPPVALFGTSILHGLRADGAPNFLGLPPAASAEQREEYLAIAREHELIVNQPITGRVNECLEAVGLPPLSTPVLESVVGLADRYMQLTVRDFEYPWAVPPSVRFVGTPPIVPNQVPLPTWAGDLDGRRKVVLVTQGTVANHDFGLLVAPVLAALANEPDLLVVVTAGGRRSRLFQVRSRPTRASPAISPSSGYFPRPTSSSPTAAMAASIRPSASAFLWSRGDEPKTRPT